MAPSSISYLIVAFYHDLITFTGTFTPMMCSPITYMNPQRLYQPSPCTCAQCMQQDNSGSCHQPTCLFSRYDMYCRARQSTSVIVWFLLSFHLQLSTNLFSALWCVGSVWSHLITSTIPPAHPQFPLDARSQKPTGILLWPVSSIMLVQLLSPHPLFGYLSCCRNPVLIHYHVENIRHVL